MNVYLVQIDKRDEESEILGVYDSRARAIRAVKHYICVRYGCRDSVPLENIVEMFGGNLEEGHFADDEKNIYIIERYVKGDNDVD